MKQELSQRAAVKRQKKDQKERKKIETALKNTKLEDLAVTFAELEKKPLNDMHDILSGTALGRNLCHLWYDIEANNHVLYYGRIEKLKTKKKVAMYTVAYWGQKESHEDDAVDYDMSKFELAADIVCGDLILS